MGTLSKRKPDYTLRVLQSFGGGFDGGSDFTDFFLAQFEIGK
jgi:hypothetical protein